MDSDMEPPKYEDVVLTPPNSSVFTAGSSGYIPAPRQYDLQLPAPDNKFSDKAQCVSCPSCHQEVKVTASAPGQFNLQILPAPYQEVVLTPPWSSVYTPSVQRQCPRQYNLQIPPDPDQSPPPQASSPKVKFSTKPQSVSCPSCQQEVVTEVEREESWCYCLACACLICTLGAGFCLMLLLPRRYTHSCPRCQATIARTGPQLSTCSLFGIFLLTVFFLFFTVIMVNQYVIFWVLYPLNNEFLDIKFDF